jgi:hypothetical protein
MEHRRVGDGVHNPAHWLETRMLVAMKKNTCLFCYKEAICLWVDNSDWEYEGITLCLPCIQGLFEKAATLEVAQHSKTDSQSPERGPETH